jgi:TctA family transporter
MLRGAALGVGFGVLPGTGPSVASFISYAVEKRVAKDPSQFGKGAIQGLTAPESANNAAAQSAFIPTLTLGIPGDAVMALMLGALMIHGIQPGPGILLRHADLFWGLVASFWIGNLMLLVLNIPLIGMWVRMITIPYHILYPVILVFACIGVYSVNNSVFDIYALLVAGIVGYLMLLYGFPAAPLLLGFILGPLVEGNFRRSMLISGGDLTIFVDRPISAGFLVTTALLVAFMLYSNFRRQRLFRGVSGDAV